MTTRDPAAVWFPASELVPWDANYLKHGQPQLDIIKASIRRNGWGSACVAQEASAQLIIGHGRLAAYLQLFEERCTYDGPGEIGTFDADEAEHLISGLVPVRFRRVPEDRAAELALADNESARHADVDADAMDAVLARLHAEDELPARALGMDEDAVAAALARINGDGGGGGTDPGAGSPPAEGEAISRLGEVYELGPHRLVCGDCTDERVWEKLLVGEGVDMLLTDPPYCSGGFQESGKSAGSIGTRDNKMIARDTLSTRGYQALMRRALALSPAGIVYIFTDWRMWINLFDVAEASGFGVRNMVVWDKGSPGMGVGWRSQHELILVGVKVKRPFDPHKAQGNVIQVKRTGNPNHPTEKPVDLLVSVIEVNADAVIVADPFGGSGPTLLACARTGRKARVIELEPGFCDVIRRRWGGYARDAGIDPGPGAL